VQASTIITTIRSPILSIHSSLELTTKENYSRPFIHERTKLDESFTEQPYCISVSDNNETMSSPNKTTNDDDYHFLTASTNTMMREDSNLDVSTCVSSQLTKTSSYLSSYSSSSTTTLSTPTNNKRGVTKGSRKKDFDFDDFVIEVDTPPRVSSPPVISTKSVERTTRYNTPSSPITCKKTADRRTLTPTTSALTRSMSNQRNSLSKKGNFINRLSIKRASTTSSQSLTRKQSWFEHQIYFNKTGQSEQTKKKPIQQIDNHILHQMITNKGISVFDLSQKHTVMIIFLRSFTCPYSKQSIFDLAKEYDTILKMNTIPVFVHQESEFLATEFFGNTSPTRRGSKSLSKRKSLRSSLSKRSSVHTIFGAESIKSSDESFNRYCEIIESFHRVHDPTGSLFYDHFGVKLLPFKSIINLSSIFSVISLAMQGYQVGISTNHLAQMRRLPALFLIDSGNIKAQYEFVDLEDRPDYIEFLVDANSTDHIDADFEFVTATGDEEDTDEVITLQQDKYIYVNNIASFPTNQVRELDLQQEKDASNGLRRTLSCFGRCGNASPNKRTSVVKVTSSNNLFAVWRNNETKKEFRKYCARHKAIEIFFLYEKLQQYKSSNSKERRNVLALTILNTFFNRESAVFVPSFPISMIASVQEEYNSKGPIESLFDEATLELELTMIQPLLCDFLLGDKQQVNK